MGPLSKAAQPQLAALAQPRPWWGWAQPGQPWEVPGEFGGIKAGCQLGSESPLSLGGDAEPGPSCGSLKASADPAAGNQMAAGIPKGGLLTPGVSLLVTGFHDL